MSKPNISYWRSLKGAVSIGLIAVAAYILLIDHTRHLIEWLPLLLLGGCLLMHTLMHGGHGGHAKHQDSAEHEVQVDHNHNADTDSDDVNRPADKNEKEQHRHS